VPVTAHKVVTISVEDDLEEIATTPFDPSPVDLPQSNAMQCHHVSPAARKPPGVQPVAAIRSAG